MVTLMLIAVFVADPATTSGLVSDWPWNVAVMFAVPAETPIATPPVAPTVATALTFP